MNQPPNSDEPVGSPESWDEAKKIAGLIGPVPGSFSSCIRFLRTDAEQGLLGLSSNSQFCLGRLLRSESFFAPIYFCALTFRETALKALARPEPWAVVKLFKPQELSLLVAIIYLFRRISKGCDSEIWNELYEHFAPRIDAGGFFGQSLPRIGFHDGLLVPCARLLSFGMFAGVNKRSFHVYRRMLKRSAQSHIAAEELKNWGCTHSQIASILLQSMGLGVVFGNRLFSGLLDNKSISEETIGDAYALRVVSMWVEELVTNGKAPDIAHKVQYFPDKGDLTTLLEHANKIQASGSIHSWLAKSKQHLSADLTSTVSSAAAPASTEGVAPEVVEAFSDKDLEELD